MAKKNPNTQIDSYVSDVDQKIQDNNEWQHRKQMIINTNYFLGNQWITWDGNAKACKEAPREQGEERITHNVIKPRVMTKLSKQTKNRLKYDVSPDTNEEARIEAAKGATKFVHYWWEEQEMDLKTRDIFLNNNVKGWCVAKVIFDTSQGDDITPDEDQAAQLGMEDVKQVKTGKVTARICDPLTMYIDNAATTESEIRWWIEETPKDVGYIEEEYGVTVLPDENINFVNNFDTSNNQNVKTNQNMAMVREMWVAPCKKYPKGLKVTCTKNVRLEVDEEAGEPPYFLFGDIPIPSSVRYDAFIKDMLPIQRNMNIALSMFAINMKRMGNNMWFIPTGSGVDEEELSNEQAGFVHYNAMAGAPPSRPEAPNMPNFFDRLLEHYNQLIDDMSGAREISQQRLPAGLDTASGLSLMVEQENEKLAVSMNNYEQGMKKVLNRVLKLMQKHYSEERLGRIVGEDGEVETVAFTGTDLSGGEDVNIVQGSSLPEMKSAQQDRLTGFWRDGAIVKKDGTPDANRYLQLMGMGDTTDLFDQHILDENKAKMENNFYSKLMEDPQSLQAYMSYVQQKQHAEMLNKEIQMQAQNNGVDPSAVDSMLDPVPKPPKGTPTVRDFYNHEIHIEQHDSFRKSKEYDELPDEIQALVDAHVAEHVSMIQQPVDPNAQAEQMKNQLAQQKLQLDAKKNETDAQLAAAKIQADKEKTAATLQAAQQDNEQQLASSALLAEQSHHFGMQKDEANHNRGIQNAHISHSQQMQRDQQNNKVKTGKK